MPVSKILLAFDEAEMKELREKKGTRTWEELFFEAVLKMPDEAKT